MRILVVIQLEVYRAQVVVHAADVLEADLFPNGKALLKIFQGLVGVPRDRVTDTDVVDGLHFTRFVAQHFGQGKSALCVGEGFTKVAVQEEAGEFIQDLDPLFAFSAFEAAFQLFFLAGSH